MMYARKCHACGVSEGVLYVIGGTDEQQPVLQCECLDLRQNTTLDEASNLRSRISYNIFRGEKGDLRWRQLSDLPAWLNGSRLVNLGSELAVISNYAAENDVILDTGENRFRPLPVREGRERMVREAG